MSGTTENSKTEPRRKLKVGEVLKTNEGITSLNNRFVLINQEDGNLILYDAIPDKHQIWESKTNEQGAQKVTMLGDGSLEFTRTSNDVICYRIPDEPAGDEDSVLSIQDNGNAVIVSRGRQLWASQSAQKRDEWTTFHAGDILYPGDALSSPNRRFRLVLQEDCNLVLLDTKDVDSVLWASSSRPPQSYEEDNGDEAGPSLKLSKQGTLAVFNGSVQKWFSDTEGKGDESSILQVKDDGNVVLLSKGAQFWQTNSKPKPTKNRIDAGESLHPGDRLTSTNGRYKFAVQSHCKFVICDELEGGFIWSSKEFAQTDRSKVTLHTDGNFIVYNEDGKRAWESGITNYPNCVLTMQDDGNATIMSGAEQLWTTCSGPRISVPAKGADRLESGERLDRGKSLTSPNGKTKLTMKDDGNCVLQVEGKEIWSTHTERSGLAFVLQDDDNIVVYGSNWTSNTRRRLSGGHAVLIVQDDGKLVLRSENVVVWCNDPALVQSAFPHMNSVQSGVSQLKMGEFLTTDQYLQSANGLFKATLMPDGNFVIRTNFKDMVVWESKSVTNPPPTKLFMRYDCNLVMLGANDSEVWATHSGSKYGFATLTLDNNGCLTVSGNTENPWKTDSPSQFPAGKGTASQLKQGESIVLGQSLVSGNKQYSLTFNESGIIFIRSKDQSSFRYVDLGLSDVQLLTFAKGTPNGDDVYFSGRSSPTPVLQMKNAKGDVLWSSQSRESERRRMYREQIKEARAEEEEKISRGEHVTTREIDFNFSDVGEPSFTMHDDGHAFIFFEDDRVWPTDKDQEKTANDALQAGESLHGGQALRSRDLAYRCEYQTDGNLVVYKGYTYQWGIQMAGYGTNCVTQKADGTLAVLDTWGNVKWHRGGGVSSGSVRTVMQTDGNLVILASETPIWSWKSDRG